MENGQHSLSGACAWLAGVDVAAALGLVSINPAAALYFGVVAAGAAVVPDQDIPGSAPARTFGPISGALARILSTTGAAIQQATRTERDYVDRDGHRTITHGALAALSMGTVIGTVCTVVGDWAVIFTGYVFTAYALRSMLGRYGTARHVRTALRLVGDVGGAFGARNWRWLWRKLATSARKWAWLTTTAVALAIAFLGAALAPAGGLGALGPWLGVTVAVGMFAHCLGDCPSVLGCPIWAPLKIAGRRWYRVRFTFGTDPQTGKPRRGFRVGGPFERRVLRPAFIALCALFVLLLLPIVRQGALDALSAVWTAVWARA